MTSRERVIEVIERRKPDRVPVYGWLKANLTDQISAAFGSVEAFEDRYEFDFSHIFGGPASYDGEALKAMRAAGGGMIEPAALLDLSDPTDQTDLLSCEPGSLGLGQALAIFVHVGNSVIGNF